MSDIEREKKRSENADGMVWKYDSMVITNDHARVVWNVLKYYY